MLKREIKIVFYLRWTRGYTGGKEGKGASVARGRQESIGHQQGMKTDNQLESAYRTYLKQLTLTSPCTPPAFSALKNETIIIVDKQTPGHRSFLGDKWCM